MMKRKVVIVLFLLFVSVLLGIQHFAIPFFSDDLGWLNTLSHESLWGDIKAVWESQCSMWLHQNGRSFNHTIWQLLCNFGETVNNIVSTILWLLAVVLVALLAIKRARWQYLLPWLLVVVAFLYCVPSAPSLFFWSAGTSHYLLPTVMTISFLLMLRWFSGHSCTQLIYIPSLFFSFVAGWTHEIFALPVSFALFVLLIWKRPRLSTLLWSMIIAYMLGASMIVASPGTWHRILSTQTSSADVSWMSAFMAKLLTSFKAFHYGRCFFALLALMVYLWLSRKYSLLNFVQEQAFYFLCLVASYAIIALLGVGDRAIWSIEVFSLIILLKWLDEHWLESKCVSYVVAGGMVLICLHQTLLIRPFFDAWKTYRVAVLQVGRKQQPTLRMKEWKSKSAWVDPFVAHPYVMMRQDMWMRIPLRNCQVCRDDIYDRLYIMSDSAYSAWQEPKKIAGDMLVPYNSDWTNAFQAGKVHYSLAPFTWTGDETAWFYNGDALYRLWHVAIQLLLPQRYPTDIIASSDNFSVLEIGDRKFIRFEETYHPVPREIVAVSRF